MSRRERKRDVKEREEELARDDRSRRRGRYQKGRERRREKMFIDYRMETRGKGTYDGGRGGSHER